MHLSFVSIQSRYPIPRVKIVYGYSISYHTVVISTAVFWCSILMECYKSGSEPMYMLVFLNNIDDLVQDWGNSNADTLMVLQTCTKPSLWFLEHPVWLDCGQSIIDYMKCETGNRLNIINFELCKLAVSLEVGIPGACAIFTMLLCYNMIM